MELGMLDRYPGYYALLCQNVQTFARQSSVPVIEIDSGEIDFVNDRTGRELVTGKVLKMLTGLNGGQAVTLPGAQYGYNSVIQV